MFSRTQQYEDLLSAKKRYDTTHENVKYWLNTMERRMDQVHLEALDANTIQVLHKELKVWMTFDPFPHGGSTK